MTEIENLEQGIAALEAQRATLGDAVVDAMLVPIRERLAALRVSLQSDAVPEQRKQVTVLFADISSFTAMSDKLDAEEVLDRMNALWAGLDQVITSYGGAIDKHIGDGVMALFGVPAAQEDDPNRAVQAALDMQTSIKTFNESYPGAPLQMRIGLNTGPVLLGEVGSRHEYTAMGDTVNLAARLEQVAPLGSVLISYDTYRHVRGFFDMQALPPVAVKGKVEPVRTYQVLQAKPRAFRLLTRGIEGVETRMIGRAGELRSLQVALRDVIDLRVLRAVTVVGDAGVGKSRLLYEFIAWADLLPEQWWIFEGRAFESTRHLPYALLRNIFSFRFEIAESDSLETAQKKLADGISGFMSTDPDSVMKAHFIGHLLGFGFSDSPYLRDIIQDAKQIRDRAFNYLVQFFMAAAKEAGSAATVLMLEDIHWADDNSLDALIYLLQNGQSLPILVLCMTRPTLYERRSDWGGNGILPFARLDLLPLSAFESNQLVDEILKKAPEVPPILRELVVTRAEGNPFYVEELIKMLIDEQAILPGEEEWQIVPERLAVVQIPATLTGILQTRLDSLSTAEKEALQCAAVVGRVFWESAVAFLGQAPGVAGVHTTDGFSVNETLQSLRQRELIFGREPSAFAGVDEYIFKHALLRDVVYETVLKRLRHTYHELAAVWLIEQSGARVNEYAGLIAEHYERAGELARSAEWYGRAGDQAASAYASETALVYFRKFIALSRELPEEDSRKNQEIDILLKVGAALEMVGRWDDAESNCRQALSTAVALVEKHRGIEQQALVARCQENLGQLLVLQGNYGEGLELLHQAQTGWRAVGDQSGAGRTLVEIGIVFWRKGEYAEAKLHLENGLILAREANDRRSMALALNNLGNVASDQGDNDAARGLYEESLVIKREMGDKRGIAGTLNNLGNVASDQGDNIAAQALYEESLAQMREVGEKRGIGMLLSNLGLMAMERGDYHAAETLHLESLELKRSMGDKPGIVMSLNNLGVVALEKMDYDTARSQFLESLALSKEVGDNHITVYDLVGLAGVKARIGSDEITEEEAEQAACLAAAAETLLASIEASMEPAIRRQYDKAVAKIHATLTDAKFEAAWKIGQTTPVEDIISRSLESDK